MVLALLAFAAAACSHEKPTPTASGSASASAIARGSASVAAIASPPASTASSALAAPPKDAPKVYKRVLHTGDSMVGGGFARALRPKVEAEGAKYFRDVWESGSLRMFSRSDRIPKLIKDLRPDLVILSLGANDVLESQKPEIMGPFVEKIAKMTVGVDCWWLGPPIWKPEYKAFVDVLRAHVAPCKFFDASDIVMQRKKDGIHPDEKGGETWADAFWVTFRGPPAPDAGLSLVVK